MSIEYLNECIALERQPRESEFRHSTVYYVKSLLQDKFKPRKFTLDEVEGLLEEVFNFNKRAEKYGNYHIPKWYREKYFKKKEKTCLSY